MEVWRQDLYLAHHGILGMKWGIRRYQNKDGTLTEAGKKRYERDIRENLSRKKDNRIDTSNPDPHRWVKEDSERVKDTVDSASNLVNKAQQLERSFAPAPKKEKLDLSSMTDQEMRAAINRELLERQYNDLFAQLKHPTISKGRAAVQKALDILGPALGVTSSALAIYMAIQKVKG